MIKVNLLPEQKAKGKGLRKKAGGTAKPKIEIPVAWILIGLAAVLGTMVVLGLVQWTREKKADSIMQETMAVDAQIKKLGGDIQKLEEYKRQKDDLEKKLNVILQLKVAQKGPVHVLDQLASAVPPRLWIQEFAENGSSMTVVGSTTDHQQISAFMDNLEKSPFFSGVELTSAMIGAAKGATATNVEAGQTLKSFQLSAAVQIPKDLK